MDRKESAQSMASRGSSEWIAPTSPMVTQEASDLDNLADFLDHLEGRLQEVANPPKSTEEDGEGGSIIDEDKEDGEDISTVIDSMQQKEREKEKEKEKEREREKDAQNENAAVVRLYQAMYDDGRRRLPNQTNALLENNSLTGFDGVLADEYQDLFNKLTGTHLNKISTKLQSLWRTKQKRNIFVKWKSGQEKRLTLHFKAWKAVAVAKVFFNKTLCRWVWRGWKQVILDQKRIHMVKWKVFGSRIGQKELSITAVNLFFSSDVIPPDAISANALKLGVRRQVLLFLLLSWKNEIKDWQRRRSNAILQLQTALRRNVTGKTHWTPELIGLVFHMWRRSLAYKRAFRNKDKLPKYNKPDLSEWNDWVRKFMTKQLLKQKADKLGLKVFQRNKLRRWRWYTRYMKGMADRLLIADNFYTDRLLKLILVTWLLYTRCRGRVFRRRIEYFRAWKEWAPKKKRLRQLKELLTMKATRNVAKRGMRCWSSCLNNIRLMHSYRLRRITDPSVFYPVMSVAYILNGCFPNYYVLWCFRRWKLLRKRCLAWKSFYFLHQRESARQLLKTIFKAWRSITIKFMYDDQDIVLEPFLSMDRIKELKDFVFNGLRPERVLNLPSSGIMLLPGHNVSADANTYVGENYLKNHRISDSNNDNNTDSDMEQNKIDKQGLYSKPSTPITELEEKVMKSIIECDEEILIDCLEKGARVDFCIGDDLRTPLHHASCYFAERYLKIVALLLHCGADVNRKDKLGMTAIDLASNPQVVILLYEHNIRLKTSPTHEEMSSCMKLMTKSWDCLGSKSLWRFTLCELARNKLLENDNGFSKSNHPINLKPTSVLTSSLLEKDPTDIAYMKRRDKRLKNAVDYVETKHRSHITSHCEDMELLRLHVPTSSLENDENENNDENDVSDKNEKGVIELNKSSSLILPPNNDDEHDDPVIGRRRQALRWLSNWSLKQEDKTLHFLAEDLITLNGENVLSRRERLESIAWRSLAACEIQLREKGNFLRDTLKERLARDMNLLASQLKREISRDLNILNPVSIMSSQYSQSSVSRDSKYSITMSGGTSMPATNPTGRSGSVEASGGGRHQGAASSMSTTTSMTSNSNEMSYLYNRSNSMRDQTSQSNSLLIEVITDALPQEYHDCVIEYRKVRNNRQINMICDILHNSISPIPYLRSCAEGTNPIIMYNGENPLNNNASYQDDLSDNDDDDDDEHSPQVQNNDNGLPSSSSSGQIEVTNNKKSKKIKVEPRQLGSGLGEEAQNPNRFAKLIMGEKEFLQEQRKEVSSDASSLIKECQVLNECLSAVNSNEKSTELAVIQGAEDMKEIELELVNNRKKARNSTFSRDRELMSKKRYVSELESELELAYTAIEEKSKSNNDRSNRNDRRNNMNSNDNNMNGNNNNGGSGGDNSRALPTAQWSEEQLNDFIKNNLNEIKIGKENIILMERKSEFLKNELSELISEKENEKISLRESNVLQLVIMDDLRESKKSIESKLRMTEKKLRHVKTFLDQVTSDLKEVTLALNSLGISTDNESFSTSFENINLTQFSSISGGGGGLKFPGVEYNSESESGSSTKSSFDSSPGSSAPSSQDSALFSNVAKEHANKEHEHHHNIKLSKNDEKHHVNSHHHHGHHHSSHHHHHHHEHHTDHHPHDQHGHSSGGHGHHSSSHHGHHSSHHHGTGHHSSTHHGHHHHGHKANNSSNDIPNSPASNKNNEMIKENAPFKAGGISTHRKREKSSRNKSIFPSKVDEDYFDMSLLESLEVDPIKTPRFDIDNVEATASFEQEIVDRYQEALGTLFPDERIKLVDLKKDVLKQHASSEAEKLELQREFGYDGGEEARGEVPKELPTAEEVIISTGKLKRDWDRIGQTRLAEQLASKTNASSSNSNSTRNGGRSRTSPNNNKKKDKDDGDFYDDVDNPSDSFNAAPEHVEELTYSYGNFGECNNESRGFHSKDPIEPSEIIDKKIENYASSITMVGDDPPPINEVEAQIIEHMTSEEKIARRLKTDILDDFLLNVTDDQMELFGEADYDRIEKPAAVVSPASNRRTRRTRNVNNQRPRSPTSRSKPPSPSTSPSHSKPSTPSRPVITPQKENIILEGNDGDSLSKASVGGGGSINSSTSKASSHKRVDTDQSLFSVRSIETGASSSSMSHMNEIEPGIGPILIEGAVEWIDARPRRGESEHLVDLGSLGTDGDLFSSLTSVDGTESNDNLPKSRVLLYANELKMKKELFIAKQNRLKREYDRKHPMEPIQTSPKTTSNKDQEKETKDKNNEKDIEGKKTFKSKSGNVFLNDPIGRDGINIEGIALLPKDELKEGEEEENDHEKEAIITKEMENNLPDLTDDEFVDWMHRYIKACDKKDAFEETMVHDMIDREIKKRAIMLGKSSIRKGLSGLGAISITPSANAAMSGLNHQQTNIKKTSSSSGLVGVPETNSSANNGGGDIQELNLAGSTPFASQKTESKGSLPEIQFGGGTGVKIVRTADGSYSYDYFEPTPTHSDNNSTNISYEEELSIKKNQGKPTKWMSPAQARWNKDNQHKKNNDVLNEKNQNQNQSLSLEMKGEAFKLPDINDVKASSLSWSNNIPTLVAGMSNNDKEQAWNDFQTLGMSEEVALAYAELANNGKEDEEEKKIIEVSKLSAPNNIQEQFSNTWSSQGQNEDEDFIQVEAKVSKREDGGGGLVLPSISKRNSEVDMVDSKEVVEVDIEEDIPISNEVEDEKIEEVVEDGVAVVEEEAEAESYVVSEEPWSGFSDHVDEVEEEDEEENEALIAAALRNIVGELDGGSTESFWKPNMESSKPGSRRSLLRRKRLSSQTAKASSSSSSSSSSAMKMNQHQPIGGLTSFRTDNEPLPPPSSSQPLSLDLIQGNSAKISGIRRTRQVRIPEEKLVSKKERNSTAILKRRLSNKSDQSGQGSGNMFRSGSEEVSNWNRDENISNSVEDNISNSSVSSSALFDNMSDNMSSERAQPNSPQTPLPVYGLFPSDHRPSSHHSQRRQLSPPITTKVPIPEPRAPPSSNHKHRHSHTKSRESQRQHPSPPTTAATTSTTSSSPIPTINTPSTIDPVVSNDMETGIEELKTDMSPLDMNVMTQDDDKLLDIMINDNVTDNLLNDNINGQDDLDDFENDFEEHDDDFNDFGVKKPSSITTSFPSPIRSPSKRNITNDGSGGGGKKDTKKVKKKGKKKKKKGSKGNGMDRDQEEDEEEEEEATSITLEDISSEYISDQPLVHIRNQKKTEKKSNLADAPPWTYLTKEELVKSLKMQKALSKTKLKNNDDDEFRVEKFYDASKLDEEFDRRRRLGAMGVIK